MIVLPPSTRTLSKEAEVVARVPLADIGGDAANVVLATRIKSNMAMTVDTSIFFIFSPYI
jgi:hypothetical protein